MAVTIFSPAKINLYLAVTGKREDGFHELVSVAAPLDFGDELTATAVERTDGPRFRLECDHREIPLDDSNLILRAAHAFVQATDRPSRRGLTGGVDFKLIKRIPMGAGLGGGSSNAMAALRALNALSGTLLSDEELGAIAAELGSDCALFLSGKPVIMRGRGELIEPLPPTAARRLKGHRVILFKPSFGVNTSWAYRRMAEAAPRHYLPGAVAAQKLAVWLDNPAKLPDLLFNNMEGVAFEKFIALPVLLQKMRIELGLEARMSGSGSTCFVLIDEKTESLPGPAGANLQTASGAELVAQMKHLIRRSWGDTVFVQEAALV